MDQTEGVQAVFASLLDSQREGIAIDSNVINQSIIQQEQAYINAVETEARSSGRPLTTDQLATLRTTAANRYDAIRQQLESFDTGELNKKTLERLVTTQKLFGAEALPTFSFLTNAFGERTASSLLDLYANVAGNPERLRAVLDSNPSLKPFIGILETDPDTFSRMVNASVTKLDDPDATLNAEDVALTDFFINQVGKNMPPTEHESLIEKLSSKGMPSKAVSSLSSRGHAIATPREEKFMQSQWDLAQQILPDQINTLIEQGNESPILTDQGVSVAVTDEGLLTLEKFKADGVTPDPQRFLHPAFNDIQKINQFLKSTDKGWGDSLGITDRTQTANNIKALIDVGRERMLELRAEAERRARGE